MFFLPESPRWLLGKNQPEMARHVLSKVYTHRMFLFSFSIQVLDQPPDSQAVEDEMRDILNSIAVEVRFTPIVAALIVDADSFSSREARFRNC